MSGPDTQSDREHYERHNDRRDTGGETLKRDQQPPHRPILMLRTRTAYSACWRKIPITLIAQRSESRLRVYDFLMARKINFEGVKVIAVFLLCILGLVCIWAYRTQIYR